MKLKASLHLHISEDPLDGPLIKYSSFDLADQAKVWGFSVLAFTCHNHFFYNKKIVDYANKQGILLLSGIELQLETETRKPHVVVLNCRADVKKIKTLDDLVEYKKKHPEIFVMAAHPNSEWRFSLGKKLFKEYYQVFDALEHTFFYSFFYNTNRIVKKWANDFSKSFVATGDVHEIKYLKNDYVVLEVVKKTPAEVVEALKKGKFKNFSRRKNIFSLAWFFLKFFLGGFFVGFKFWLKKF